MTSKRKNRSVWVLGILLSLAGICWWLTQDAPEQEGPLHKGRSLAGWFRILRHPDSSESQRTLAETALTEMGTNVIPGILLAMEKPDAGKWKNFYDTAKNWGLIDSVPSHIQWSEWWAIRDSLWINKEIRPQVMEALFHEYKEILNDHDRLAEQKKLNLMRMLHSFNDEIDDFLHRKMGRQVPEDRAAAVSLLGFVGRPPVKFLPLVGTLIEDDDRQVRWYALNTICRFRPFPPSNVSNIVHHLRKALHDPDPALRKTAASLLTRYGLEAREAVPRLKELAEQEPERRNYYLEIVKKVNPPGHE